jgi:GNAT superfamily N-acetyltransferase
MSLVRPEYGPTLPELLRRVPRVVRWGVWAALAVLAAVVLFVGGGGTAPAETSAVIRGERTFNLAWSPERLHRTDVPGALLALEGSRDGLFLDSFTVRAVTLPAYRGAGAGAVLPLLAAQRLAEVRGADGFVASNPPEGRARVNESPGYQITWRERRGGRTIYARDIWLLPPVDGARDAVRIELRSTPAAGTPNADRTGGTGALKQPLRSFRFGTERQGGE